MPRRERALVHSRTENGKKVAIFLMPLSEEQYVRLVEDNNDILLENSDRTFSVSPKTYIFAGPLDFENDKDLEQRIENLDNRTEYRRPLLFSFLGNTDGISDNIPRIPANYDYATHTCTTDIGRYKTKELHSRAEAMKYAHGVIGKPPLAICFKATITW